MPSSPLTMTFRVQKQSLVVHTPPRIGRDTAAWGNVKLIRGRGATGTLLVSSVLCSQSTKRRSQDKGGITAISTPILPVPGSFGMAP